MISSARVDMQESARRLASLDTDEVTQLIQKEVLAALNRLKDALKQERRKREKEKKEDKKKKNEQKQQSVRRLIPPLAELKLLREMQIDVHKRTQKLYDAAKANDGDLDMIQQRLLQRLTNKQGNIRDVLKKMNDVLEEQARKREAAKKAAEAEKPGAGK